MTGPDPAPRAWDYLFSGYPEGWVRLRLKSGTWLGGKFTRHEGGSRRKSYVAGSPEPQDIFLAVVVETDPETGEFGTDEHGTALPREGGLLVRWEVEYLEFIDG